MEEVKAKRVGGPFADIPFEFYMQSPIGLVPKLGGQTRMIFHLLYDFDGNENQSLNYYTPKELCTVKYNDLDMAMRYCIRMLEDLGVNPGNEKHPLWFSKTNLKSAFHLLLVKRTQWKWLIFKVKHPIDGNFCYFIDKCVPFGASHSCALFQSFSEMLRHLLEYYTGCRYAVVNYLDDFLFIALDWEQANLMVSRFLKISFAIGFTLAEEKTEAADTRVVFLGILLDGKTGHLIVPEEKRLRAIKQLSLVISKRSITVLEV